MMSDLKKCTKCLLPETYETIEFDIDGVCNICRQTEYKNNNLNWEERKKLLDELIESYRGQYDYDCIVPFSGGKDSTYTLWYLMHHYNIKPLVVRFDHLFMRPGLEKNTEKTLKKLGVDSIKFSPNWKIVKKLMLESLIRKGDFCWHCHTGIFAYPMHIAIKFNVPLVLWGEPSSEYTAYYDYKDDEIEMVDEKRFNRFVNLGITAEDIHGMINSETNPIDKRDLLPYSYPDIKELKRIKYHSVCLGSFIPWDVRENVKVIQKELEWDGFPVEGIPFELYPYEKIECFMQGVRDYIKFVKRGYSRVTQMTSLDIRNNRISRDAAIKLINFYEGKRPASLDIFLEYLDISEGEFNAIIMKTAIPPYRHCFANQLSSSTIPDLSSCYREH